MDYRGPAVVADNVWAHLQKFAGRELYELCTIPCTPLCNLMYEEDKISALLTYHGRAVTYP